MYGYVCMCICIYVYMGVYICICIYMYMPAVLQDGHALVPRSKTSNHKPCIIISSSLLSVYIDVFVCIGVYVSVHVYICKVIVDPIWTMKVKSLKCHSLNPRVLVGRFFLPFISKWLGREMGFYVPLSPTWEPGSCVWLAPPTP